MSKLSRYVEYLPPVLWSEQQDPSQFLGRMLRIFEHLLTGMPDAAEAVIVTAEADTVILAQVEAARRFSPSDLVTIVGTQERARISHVEGNQLRLLRPLSGRYSGGTLRLASGSSFEAQIDGLADLFDPWRAPPELLPWLASWVALELQPDWNAYQTRKFIADIVPIYQQRGLKQGLLTYLDIYATTRAKPRIAIDDGEALVKACVGDSGALELQPLAFSQVVTFPDPLPGAAPTTVGVLLHPTAVATDADGSYFVTDAGGRERLNSVPTEWPAALWKLSSAGEISYGSGSPPLPQPLYSGSDLSNPTAIVVDEEGVCYVLSVGTTSSSRDRRSAVHRFAPPDYAHQVLIAQAGPNLPAIHPVDMVLGSGGRFFILDRGDHRGTRTAPQLVLLDQGSLTTTVRPLAGVTEPTAIAQDPASGQLVIADAREPRRTTDSSDQPAALFQVDPDTGALTPLLSGVENNPLIFPTGMVYERAGVLLVCDRGVRQRENGRGNTVKAEAAGIYRVDLNQTPPTVTAVTADRRLVYPTKIARDTAGDYVLTDWGTTYEPSASTNVDWRTRPNTFGVSVIFSQERPTERTERNRIRFDISQLIEVQKPGHTSWWLDDRKLQRIHHIR